MNLCETETIPQEYVTELLETFAFAAAERRQTVPLIAIAREEKDRAFKKLVKSRKLIQEI